MSISQKQTSVIVLVLLSINPIIGMAVDLVSPSLPAITLSLNISAKVAKDVISIYLLGYALGNFSMGFLTDALGRQTLIRIMMPSMQLSILQHIPMNSNWILTN